MTDLQKIILDILVESTLPHIQSLLLKGYVPIWVNTKRSIIGLSRKSNPPIYAFISSSNGFDQVFLKTREWPENPEYLDNKRISGFIMKNSRNFSGSVDIFERYIEDIKLLAEAIATSGYVSK